MAGQLGNKQSTVKNLEVIKIDSEKGLILIKGAIPGAPGAHLNIRSAAISVEGHE